MMTLSSQAFFYLVSHYQTRIKLLAKGLFHYGLALPIQLFLPIQNSIGMQQRKRIQSELNNSWLICLIFKIVHETLGMLTSSRNLHSSWNMTNHIGNASKDSIRWTESWQHLMNKILKHLKTSWENNIIGKKNRGPVKRICNIKGLLYVVRDRK